MLEYIKQAYGTRSHIIGRKLAGEKLHKPLLNTVRQEFLSPLGIKRSNFVCAKERINAAARTDQVIIKLRLDLGFAIPEAVPLVSDELAVFFLADGIHLRRERDGRNIITCV
ncbi:hypothetical protein SDC9_101677 [bioreactor metagenome]|uniref:Uncharacterized protein n=1 Tax=bioreactor metagenome TaxID=1076179 RepID=A0A645AZF4_9ZZZZ